MTWHLFGACVWLTLLSTVQGATTVEVTDRQTNQITVTVKTDNGGGVCNALGCNTRVRTFTVSVTTGPSSPAAQTIAGPVTTNTLYTVTFTGLVSGGKYTFLANGVDASGTVQEAGSATDECTLPTAPSSVAPTAGTPDTSAVSVTLTMAGTNQYDTATLHGKATGCPDQSQDITWTTVTGVVTGLSPGCQYSFSAEASCDTHGTAESPATDLCTRPDKVDNGPTVPATNTIASWKLTALSMASGYFETIDVSATATQADCPSTAVNADAPATNAAGANEVTFGGSLTAGCNYDFTMTAKCTDGAGDKVGDPETSFNYCTTPVDPTNSLTGTAGEDTFTIQTGVSSGSATSITVTVTPATGLTLTPAQPMTSADWTDITNIPVVITGASDSSPYTVTAKATCTDTAARDSGDVTITVNTASTRTCATVAETYTIATACDGENHCTDGSDEFGCTGCTATQFKCHDNTPTTHASAPYFGLYSTTTDCIDGTLVCNDINDCGDFSDEEGCDTTNANTEVHCPPKTGTVVKTTTGTHEICDGNNDCGDFEDERGCTGCAKTEYRCKSNTALACIADSLICDGNNDCPYYEDEAGCAASSGSCTSSQWLCGSTCMETGSSNANQICDGLNNCGSYEDEKNCNQLCAGTASTAFYCSSGPIAVETNAVCVATGDLCNGDSDCHADYAFKDELGCGTCSTTQYKCKSSTTCVTFTTQVCNGENDCGDYSDEISCTTSCVGEFHCDETDSTTPVCVASGSLCDGKNDCGIVAAEKYKDELGCSACAVDEFSCNNVPATCKPITDMCNGVNDCGDYSDEQNCNAACSSETNPETSFYCPTITACIDISKTCDGVNDCGDYEDERGCTTGSCASNQIYCGTQGGCIAEGLTCNNENDCHEETTPAASSEHYIDEQGCGPNLGTPCDGTQYLCGDGTTCIARTALCDDTNDCGDFTDELSCSTECFTGGGATRAGTNVFACPNDPTTTCLFLKGDGTLSALEVCNGENDCGGSNYYDEAGCTAGCATLSCGTGPTCLATTYICNDVNDCGDYEDELNCPDTSAPVCAGGEFRCLNDALCTTSFCDGNNDCGDYSDEINCAAGCAADPSTASANTAQFACEDSTNRCIDLTQTCDGVNDCGTVAETKRFNDELNCEENGNRVIYVHGRVL